MSRALVLIIARTSTLLSTPAFARDLVVGLGQCGGQVAELFPDPPNWRDWSEADSYRPGMDPAEFRHLYLNEWPSGA